MIKFKMPLTYTEIEQQKNTRIVFFFAVVVLFYFAAALIVANVAKLFLVSQFSGVTKAQPFLSRQGAVNVTVFALAAAVIHIYFSLANGMVFIQKNLRAQQLDTKDRYHKRFQKVLEEVNVATGNKYSITPMVIPAVALNAFAVSDHSARGVVGVTEGLLTKLTRPQLQAVVAHEVAHITSGDSFQTTIGCALFGIYAAMLNGLKNALSSSGRGSSLYSRNSGGVVIVAACLYGVLAVVNSFYTLIRMALSRNRELRADAIAVRITRDPLSLSEALYTISRGWRGLGVIDQGLESLFILNPAEEECDQREDWLSSLFSTHPPINKRIRILAGLAHAEVKNIQESVIRQEKLKDNFREKPTEKKQLRWMLMDQQNSWQGPFSVSQMMLLGWLRPDTWIKSLEQEGLKQAKQEPFLKPLFDDRLKRHKSSSFDCPKCNQALVEEEYEGTVIHRCLFCAGLLVDGQKISRIILRKEKGFNERIKKLASLTQKNGYQKIRQKLKVRKAANFKCQKCGARMARNFYTLAYLVEVEKCHICGLVWFDKDELEVLQYLIENKGSV
ncbi:M48 family metalloprotease [Candidatus Omnitrophota bacterium]